MRREIFQIGAMEEMKNLKTSKYQCTKSNKVDRKSLSFARKMYIFLLLLSLPSRITQSLKAAIVFDRDVTVKVSSENELNLQNLVKTVKRLVSILFLSRTMCLGFTIAASWSKMPFVTQKLSFKSEVKFVYLSFLRNFYFVNHLNNTNSQQMLRTF
jgi:hypothetical protein